MRIGMVVAEYNRDVTSKMEAAAEKEVKKLGHKLVGKFHVAGVLDVPVGADYLLKHHDIDGIVVLGAILQGETNHDIVVADVASGGIAQLMVKYGKPIGWGISGPRQTKAQAAKRADLYARDAVKAAVKTFEQMK